MPFAVEFRDLARDDLEVLSANIRRRVLRAVEARLVSAPHRYGDRLRKSLSGLWKLRVGDLRVVYELSERHVTIWAVRDRKDVYPEVARRLGGDRR